MLKQRRILLSLSIVIFVLVATAFTFRVVQFKKTHYKVGSVPPEIVNQLLPKDVPISSIRPPALRAIDPIRYGGTTSVVSIIEYGDYECEYCRRMRTEIDSVARSYNGLVRFVWRDFPIEEIHKGSTEVAIFARCAALQGKYWPIHDALMTAEKLNEKTLQQIADSFGLDPIFQKSCRQDAAMEQMVLRDLSEARADGINSAPFIFVGTQAFDGYVDAETLRQAVEKAISS
ncbi:MAG: thioredoxin domain-containing protein, partial [Patescibacteria group bacterium]